MKLADRLTAARKAFSETPNATASPSIKADKIDVVKGKEPTIYGVTGNGGRSFYGMATGEYVTALMGYKGRQIFDEMRRSDPKVGSVLKAITLPIRGANWFIEPASEDEADQKIAKVIENNLLHGMSQTWDDTVRHILLMLPFGFSVLEKVWEYRDDGVLGIRKLDPRLPLSIVDWKYDGNTRALIGPEQMDADGTRYILPIEKLLVFTNDKEGDNWEGVSILRTAYKPWFIKSNLEKIDAIKHDRYGVGVPVMTAPNGTKSGDAAWTDAETTLENLQAQEQSYIVKPEGWLLEVLNGGTVGDDAIPSIKYHDEAIGKAMLAQFIDLGTSQTGSRALGVSFIDLFNKSIKTYAGYICDVVNRFLIREYVNYNWDVKQYPTLKVNGISDIDTVGLAALVTGKLITPDDGLEAVLRESLELPCKEEVAPLATLPAVPENPTDQQTADDEEQTPELNTRKKGIRLASATSPEVQLVDIEGMAVQLDNAKKTALRTVLDIKEQQRISLVAQASQGKRVTKVQVSGKLEMFQALVSAYRSQYVAGKEQVRKEMEKQIGKRLAMITKKRPRVSQNDLFDLMEDQISLEVEGAASKLESMVLQTGIVARKSGIVGEALLKYIDMESRSFSEAGYDSIVDGAVNGGWGAGRDFAAQEYADGVAYVYRSAILDGNACEQCAEHDGEQWPPGEEQVMPDPECYGGGRCRCVNIYVMKSEGGA